ncbi:MAG: type II secretion system protein, partial [Selenomonadaceae bacterium]|nr:type II secretion system protein [Selenomonadaceae bacterium]
MYFPLKKQKSKKEGYILFETFLALIVFGMLSSAFFMIFSGQFSMINSSRDALQAQQYAQVEAEMLRISEYEDLESKVKARSPMTSWANPD